MKNFLKNKTLVIILGVVVILAVAGGGYFFLAARNAANNTQDQYPAEEVVEKMNPDAIGLTITAKPDKKAVKFAISKPQGITSIEYQVTYDADSTAAEKSEGGEARVQRGITGESKLKSGSSFSSEWLDLGSCSKNVCRYDTGVNSVTLTLKVVKDGGKVYKVEKTLAL